MSDIRDLYQEVVFDHYRRPRNHRALADATHRAEGHNPLCGDQLSVYLKVEDGRIAEASFEGSGCAISTASASLMTEALKGKTLEEAEAMFADFHRRVAGTGEASAEAQALGKLEVLCGVREFPARIKCATLAWHAVHAALSGEARASTE